VKTYVATTNEGKLRELRAIFAGSPLQLTKPRKLAAVREDAETFEGNALLKARSLADALSSRAAASAVLADDSGLVVDALEGRPGVHSARYGGVEIDWPRRRALLLEELNGIPPYRRTAHFICVLAFIAPQAQPVIATGRVDGFVMETERGSGGFGYDPLFFYPPAGCSFAALSEEEKNAVSHRRRAAEALLGSLGRVQR
jgi:XTP/dITP diphosphohydrolase